VTPSFPSPEDALRLYRRTAPQYDRRLGIRLAAPVRRRAVRRLTLRPGQTVLDIACGTGLNLAALRAGVGSLGRVIGVDLSPEMLAFSRRRVQDAG
jgi:ubiquinone/menaquinone biosynthesis C-methylase UbiE